MKSSEKTVLLLGLGNILQRDDGAGIHVIDEIKKAGNLPPCVQIEDGGTLGFDLISLMAPFRKILIVDALRVDDEPGSIYHFSSWDAPPEDSMLSLHDMGIMHIIRTMQLLGYDPIIEFIGINAADISTFSMGLSEPVSRAIPKAIQLVHELLQEYEKGGF